MDNQTAKEADAFKGRGIRSSNSNGPQQEILTISPRCELKVQ